MFSREKTCWMRCRAPSSIRPGRREVFSALLPVPFYFLELLVGFVQAIVFMLLTAVFTGVICAHDEEQAKRTTEDV